MPDQAEAAVVTALRVGEPDIAGPLAVYPVFAPAAGLEYRSFAEAIALGAGIHELEPAPSVNDVIVHNPLDVGVLLYEGEEIQGAQQDRTLDRSVLIPPASRLQVPVSCVEHGRWDGDRHGEAFTPAPQTAFPELRRAKSRAARASGVGRAEQGEVWRLVGEKADRHGVSSATGAMRDVFETRRSAVDELRAQIERRDGQVGAVAAVGGELCVVDVVGRADVFAALHGPLVTGYALDAAEQRSDAVPPAAPGIEAVQLFLAAALAAAGRDSTALGTGRHTAFANAVVEGTRLQAEGELVALTAFPGERMRTRIRRPSHRR
jgi:hypothetical protein